jgi:phosphoribosylformylglycinamidine cyclo-ligase
VAGVAEGCRRAGCALVGGETAELPDLYAPGEYDLAGFAVGIVERERIVDGAAVKPGDVLLGLASSGLHSNGYSLARRIVFDVMRLGLDALVPGTGRSVADVLLEPTRIYVRAVLAVRESVTAMAHITGGGLSGNLPRVLPDGCRALLRPATWAERRPPIFQVLQEAGHVSDAEMLRTFNMGIGYVVMVPPEAADAVSARLAAAGEDVFVLGEVAAGERGVELVP